MPSQIPTLRLLLATLLLLALALPTLAQDYTVEGTFQAAVWANNGDDNDNDQSQDLTTAASAQCPANFPESCNSIGQGAYCCPSGSTCQLASNNQVGCCASKSGNKCTGSLSNGNAYQPSSHYEPAPSPTVTQKPDDGNYNGGGAVVVGAGNDATTTVVQQGGFCTTIIAEGDNLPTTANARCGTALVVEAGASGRMEVGGLVLGLQVLGAWVVLRRW